MKFMRILKKIQRDRRNHLESLQIRPSKIEIAKSKQTLLRKLNKTHKQTTEILRNKRDLLIRDLFKKTLPKPSWK